MPDYPPKEKRHPLLIENALRRTLKENENGQQRK